MVAQNETNQNYITSADPGEKYMENRHKKKFPLKKKYINKAIFQSDFPPV